MYNGYCDFIMDFISAGSSHSDKEVDANTPEKVPRTTSERKRKRKADDGSGNVASGSITSKGARSVAALDNKKINEYFPKHHLGNSPIRHGGAKSPSPQQGYPMVRDSVFLTVNVTKIISTIETLIYTTYVFLLIVSTITSTITFTTSNNT